MVLLRIYKGKHRYYREKIAEFIGNDGLDVNATCDLTGYTALHRASYKNKPECVEILLRFGANINATNDDGDTALHEASYHGKPKCLEILLKFGAK